MFRVVLLVCFTFLSCETSVYSDPFAPSGDSKYCEFAQTGALSYSRLPSNSAESGLTYNSNSVRGVTSTWIQITDFEDIGDVTYPDARRDANKASVVAVPPNAIVNMGAYFFNYSGHPVQVREGIFYVSRANPGDGDLTRLGAPGIDRTTTIRYGGIPMIRRGKAFSFSYWQVKPVNIYPNLPNGEIIRSFMTIQPIQIKKREIVPEFRDDGELYLIYTVELENTSSYQISSVVLQEQFPDGEQYEQVITDFPANSAKVFTYEKCLCDDYQHDTVIPRLKVLDNTWKTESVGVASPSTFSYNPETRTFFTRRNDVGVSGSWSGYQGDFTAVGSGPYIVLRLMPYQIYSTPKVVSVRPQIVLQTAISDGDEIAVKQNSLKVGENMKLSVEVSNAGAYAKNLIVDTTYDPTVFKPVGGDVIEEGRVRKIVERLDNQEKVRLEFEFVLSGNVENSDEQQNFSISVEGEKVSKIQDASLSTEIISLEENKDSADVPTQVTFRRVVVDEISAPKGQVLASTGESLFSSTIMSSIMSLWSIKAFKKLKKKEKLR